MSTLEFPRLTGTEQGAGEETATLTPAARQSWLTVENGAYLFLGLLALLAHLWGLGDRALHHDETLHAFYSWNIYTAQGYIHDPLLHGPFLYYIGALNYFLFSDNDFTARLGAGLFGTVLTLLPYLIRRELGRPAALMAACYLLISPVALYVGRFVRHDIYSMVFEMLVLVAIVRYAGTRHPRWLYVGAAAFGLMVVNQETSYLFSIIVGAPLLLIFLWRVYRPGIPILGLLAMVIATLIFVLPGTAQVDGAHNAIRDPQTGLMQYTPGPLFGWYPLETYDNSYALRIRNRSDNDGGRSLLENFGLYLSDLWKFFAHPAVLSAIAMLLIGLALLGWLIWGRRDRDELTAWQRARARPDPIIDVYASLFANWHWLAALGLFFAIYALFFSAFLTNLLGVITGVSGSLLYWLAQHNVERGGQPDYYYPVILSIYEPLLYFWGAIGIGLVALGWWRYARARRNQESGVRSQESGVRSQEALTSLPIAQSLSSQALILPTVLLWWAFAALEIYSWAGERMPWLTIHIVLPMVLFAAWAAQNVLLQIGRNAPQEAADEGGLVGAQSAFIMFASLFAVFVCLGFVLMTAYIGSGQRLAIPLWSVPAVTLLLLTILCVAAGIRWGWRWTFGVLALCLTVAGGIYTVRSTYRLVYLSGDTPREMLIYTQTSPDVMHVVRRLEEASRRRGGDLSMPVIYDNETVWSWYMRDFTRATRTGPELSGPPGADVQAVLMLQENIDRYPQNRTYLEGFRIQRLPLRWWFPEDDMYKLRSDWRSAPLEEQSLLGRVLRAPFDHETLARLWDFLLFRDTRAPLGSTDFVIAVRPQLADEMGLGIGGNLQPEFAQP